MKPCTFLLFFLTLGILSLHGEAGTVTYELKLSQSPALVGVATVHRGELIGLPSTIGATFATAGRLRFPLTGGLRLEYWEDHVRVVVAFRDTPEARRMEGRLPRNFSVVTVPERTEVTARMPAGTKRAGPLYDGFREAVQEAGFTVIGPVAEWVPSGSRRDGPFLLTIETEPPDDPDDQAN